ncbi:putative amino-acid permease [Hypsibius exemplaris]|uniref:Amino-acid permease n=1 Tax=Hypsibius exemplaris TaxID=2072580 RepID=A0A1W0X5L7_HYPEX|nr:putative amino-acid permease [Hypsibius exemplaris]
MNSDMEMTDVRGNWSSADLVDREPPPRPPWWRRWIDSFKPMEHHASDRDTKANEAGEGVEFIAEGPGLKRTLKNRHIQMIAIGGAIGTGLFIGSGGVLAKGGPASLLLGFILIGTMLFNVVMALGEMAVLYPIAGSFSVYSARFIGSGLGVRDGLELRPPMAGGVAARTDRRGHHHQGYGEAEFIFSMIKIVAVTGFIILGVVINVGGAPDGKFYGVTTWHDPGAFNHGFQGFCSVFVTAAFAFGGTEMVGLAAAESANPRKCLPRATKQVFWRISIFYIVTLFLIGLIVPYDHPRLLGNNPNASSHDATASPFVIAITDAGIKILPSIFNGVILVSVLSVGNSAVYGSSRTLSAMAHTGQAPRFLGYVDRQGRPLFAIILALLLGGLAYLVEAGAASEDIFGWLLAISGLSTIFTCPSAGPTSVSVRLESARPHAGRTALQGGIWSDRFLVGFDLQRSTSAFFHYVHPEGHPYSFANGTLREPDLKDCGASAESFFNDYLAAPIVLIFFVVWKLLKKTPFMVVGKGNKTGPSLFHTETIDLVTGRRELDLRAILEEERAEHAKLPAWQQYYHSLCG